MFRLLHWHRRLSASQFSASKFIQRRTWTSALFAESHHQCSSSNSLKNKSTDVKYLLSNKPQVARPKIWKRRLTFVLNSDHPRKMSRRCRNSMFFYYNKLCCNKEYTRFDTTHRWDKQKIYSTKQMNTNILELTLETQLWLEKITSIV